MPDTLDPIAPTKEASPIVTKSVSASQARTQGGGQSATNGGGMTAELVNFSSPPDNGRVQATRFTAGEADVAVPSEQSPAKTEKQEKSAEKEEKGEKKDSKRDEAQGKPPEQVQAKSASSTRPDAKPGEKAGAPQATGAANQAAAGAAPGLPNNIAAAGNTQPNEGAPEKGADEGQANPSGESSGDEAGAAGAPEKAPEQLPSGGGGGPQGGSGPTPQQLPSSGAKGGGGAGGGTSGAGGRGGSGGSAEQQNKGQQGPTEAELREQQKNEEDSNFDLILFTLLLPPAILFDLICLIPLVAEVIGTLMMPAVRFLFWLLNIRPGRLIENLINRILKQQAEGMAGPNVPLPKETGIVLRAVFDALFVSLTAIRLIPLASEVSFSTTIFIFVTYVLCKAEERAIKTVKQTLKVAGAVGRVAAKLPIPQAKAIGGAVAAADDVVNKGTPAGQAVQQEMGGAIPGAGAGGMGVGQQVGVGQVDGEQAAVAGSGGAGAQGSPLISGTPMFTGAKGKGGAPVDGIQGPAPRQPKSEFARAKQRMNMQPRLQKRVRRKYGLPEDDEAYVSGSRDEILDEGIKATEGDGGRFAKEKPLASGSPIVGADNGTPSSPPLGK